jgi:hypothetical protein
MTLSSRGWKRQAPTDPTFPRAKVRTPRRSRAFTRGRVLVLLPLLVVIIILVLPRHIKIGGYHVHPGFAPSLAPYIFL